LVFRTSAGEAKGEEDEGDGQAEEESASCVVKGGLVEAEVFAEDGGQEAGDKTENADGEEAAGFGAEVSSGEAHGGVSFLGFSL